MDELIGQVISSIEINEDKTHLIFYVEKSKVYFEIDSEACSSKEKIVHFTSLSTLLGYPILKVSCDCTDADWFDPQMSKMKDEVTIKLFTEKGTTSIILERIYTKYGDDYYPGAMIFINAKNKYIPSINLEELFQGQGPFYEVTKDF